MFFKTHLRRSIPLPPCFQCPVETVVDQMSGLRLQDVPQPMAITSIWTPAMTTFNLLPE